MDNTLTQRNGKKNEKISLSMPVILAALFLWTVESMTICPKYSKVFFTLGFQSEKKMGANEASRYYNKSISLDPNFPHPYYRLGIINHNNSDYSKAIEYFQKAVYLDPGFHAAYDYLGLSYLAKGYYENAIAALKKAIQVNNNVYRFHLGIAYLKSGNIKYAYGTVDDLKVMKEFSLAGKLEDLIKNN